MSAQGRRKSLHLNFRRTPIVIHEARIAVGCGGRIACTRLESVVKYLRLCKLCRNSKNSAERSCNPIYCRRRKDVFVPRQVGVSDKLKQNRVMRLIFVYQDHVTFLIFLSVRIK